MDRAAPVSLDRLEALSKRLQLGCSSAELHELMVGVPRLLGDIERARQEWADLVSEATATHVRSFWRPTPAENRLNAWTVRSAIAGDGSGLLQGRTVAVKDNIAVAGLPLENGSELLEGYIADADAEVVTRVLDAGGIISGKARCENFCLSGGSHTGYGGPVLNPMRHTHTTGGSSSGCAALVASCAVDMAIGGDQRGSVRIPSSFCGIVGLKPTWGRVPYSGAMSMEPSVDHLGPMTRSVADNLRLFTVLAGERRSKEHLKAVLDGGVRNMRVGLLSEGMGQPHSQPGVDLAVRRAAAHFAAGGATVSPVSVPEHRLAPALWTAIGLEGVRRVIWDGDGHGDSSLGAYPTRLIEKMRTAKASEFAAALRTKQFVLAAEIAHEAFGTAAYSFSRNAAAILRRKYDAVLQDVDVLIMPTTPHTASPLPSDSSLAASNLAAESMAANTVPFNLSHHPALSIPCGVLDGLPVGLMLVGRHNEEHLLYRAAAFIERRE